MGINNKFGDVETEEISSENWLAFGNFIDEPYSPLEGYRVVFSTSTDCLLYIRWILLPYACTNEEYTTGKEVELSVMQSQEKFSLLRSILRTLGLSSEAVDDVIERIVDFLYERSGKPADQLEYPYLLRDDFLSPAEQSFYLVLVRNVWIEIRLSKTLDLYYETLYKLINTFINLGLN